MRAGAVDVYWVNLDDEPDPPRLSPLLDDDERERARRFRFSRDRARFIVRHAYLRHLLAQYVKRPPQALPLVRNPFGKPQLDGGGVQFSLSCSGPFALYAVAQDREVGCDLEWRNPTFAVDEIAGDILSAAERDVLLSLNGNARREGFFNCWTRKEAFAKAMGKGVSLPFDSFSVSLAPGADPELLSGCEGWSVCAFEPIPSYHAAVVARGTDWTIASKVLPIWSISSRGRRCGLSGDAHQR